MILSDIATGIGYIVMSVVGFVVITKLLFSATYESQVSDEAKQIAKKTDPNNPLSESTKAAVAEMVLDEIRELGSDETIRADPAPLTHFDWSVDDARQEDIEHILYTLREAGYYTHPLPDVNHYSDPPKWSRERAGVWRSEPDWHIVEYNDDGSIKHSESVDIPEPDEWSPKSAA